MNLEVDYRLVIRGDTDVVDALILRAKIENLWSRIKCNVHTVYFSQDIGCETSLHVTMLNETQHQVIGIIDDCDQLADMAKKFNLKVERSCSSYKI